jgi:hypothetical protein
MLAGEAQAQFNYTTNNGTITIVEYTGSGGAMTVPATIDGLPVTSIGDEAFAYCYSLINVTIPNSVTNLGRAVFAVCTNLASVTLGNSVTSIGNGAFYCTGLTSVAIPNSDTTIGTQAFEECRSLASVTIGNGVTTIGDEAFWGCTRLTSVTIPDSVTNIGTAVFSGCTILTGIYFLGNAPSGGGYSSDNVSATVYYLPGTAGWGKTLGGLPTALWLVSNPLILNNGPRFGVLTNRFGFVISWATNLAVVVEACTNLAKPAWSPVGTNTLTGGSSYFSDPRWTNIPVRFYRLRSP